MIYIHVSRGRLSRTVVSYGIIIIINIIIALCRRRGRRRPDKSGVHPIVKTSPRVLLC